MPFKLNNIQVDGCSGFRTHFEQDCKDLKIPLFVLPPCSLDLTGVEQLNRIARRTLLIDSNKILIIPSGDIFYAAS